MGNKLDIPKHLKSKEWNSHKGIIAKMTKSTKKTGITEVLKAFEDYYNFKGAWGLWGDSEVAGYAKWAIDPNPSTSKSGVQHLKNGKDSIDKFLKGLKDKLDAVKNLATTKAVEFKKATLIPSSSRVYLEDMAKAAVSFANAVTLSVKDSEKKIDLALSKATKK